MRCRATSPGRCSATRCADRVRGVARHEEPGEQHRDAGQKRDRERTVGAHATGERPARRQHCGTGGDQQVARGEEPRRPDLAHGRGGERRNGTAQHAPRGPCSPREDHHGGNRRSDRGKDAREGVEVLAAGGHGVGIDGAVERRGEDHTDREPREHEQHARGGATRARSGEQVHGAETEPRHVDHRTEREEHAERRVAPSARLGPPQGHRGDHEQPHGDRPGQFVGAATSGPPVEGAQPERQGHDGGGRSECGVESHVSQG